MSGGKEPAEPVFDRRDPPRLLRVDQESVLRVREVDDVALAEEDLEIYAEILSSAAAHWKGRRKHRLYLVLPEKMRGAFPSGEDEAGR